VRAAVGRHASASWSERGLDLLRPSVAKVSPKGAIGRRKVKITRAAEDGCGLTLNARRPARPGRPPCSLGARSGAESPQAGASAACGG